MSEAISYVQNWRTITSVANTMASRDHAGAAASFFVRPNGDKILTTHSCHARILTSVQEGFRQFCTFVYTQTEGARSYLDWILSEESSWKDVVPQGSWELVYDLHEPDLVVGINFLTDEFCKKDPVLFYNFLVASRQACDVKYTSEDWYFFRKNTDLHPSDCNVLAHLFSTYRGMITECWKVDGCHKPFNSSNYSTRYLSPSALRGEKPRDKGTVGGSSVIWNTNQKKNFSIGLGLKKSSVIKGAFSEVNGYSLEEIVSKYKETFYEL